MRNKKAKQLRKVARIMFPNNWIGYAVNEHTGQIRLHECGRGLYQDLKRLS